MKACIYTLTLIFSLFFGFSQNQVNKIEFDSLVNYKVKKKETLYSISKKFNAIIDDILLYNPELNNSKLKKNSIIIIPFKKRVFDQSVVENKINIDTINNNTKPKIKKDYIKLAYLAPFKLNSIELDSVEQVEGLLKEINLTTISINFYNGILTAVDELKNTNVKVSVDVFDTQNNTNQVLSIRDSNDFDNYDLIVGPLIKRNYNIFNQNIINTNSISPLVYDDLNLNPNTIMPVASANLKRDKMYSIIDSLILETQDQCALIISDSINIKSRNKLLEKFPLAELIDLNSINNSVDPKIADSLLGNFKENWVFLETKKPNLISSVTSLLNAQLTSERKIRLFSSVSNENYDNPNVNYEKLGNLSFMYPSNSAPNINEDFIEFQNNYLSKFEKYPDNISIKAFDIIKDLLYRISVSKSLEKSLDMGETRSIQNKFNYSYDDKTGFKNNSFFILRHEDLNIIEHQN